MQLDSRTLETWVRLVTRTCQKSTRTDDAAQYLHDINHTSLDFLAPARPDPLTTDELVNEL